MNGKKEQLTDRVRGLTGTLFNLILTLVTVLVFNYAHVRYYREATFYSRGNYVFLLLYVLLVCLLLTIYGAYRIRQYRTRELVFSYVMGSVLANVIIYLVMCLIAVRMLGVWAILLVTVVQCVLATGIYVLCRILLPMIEPVIPTLFIHTGNEWDNDVPAKFDKRRTSYSVQETVYGNSSWSELKRAMEPYSAVLIGNVPRETKEWIISYCFRTGRRTLLVPGMTDILVGSASPIVMGDALLYDLNTQRKELPYLTAKRLLDIVASAAGLILLSPVMLGTALAIRLQDRGPVFYRQVRLTEGGRRFQLTKFRSMIVNAEKETGAVLAGKEDERITRVGRFIRAARIDELPQLWNILRGDMTLVGPRPERPEFYETICEDYPEFYYRLKVKAGLTGYAQLYGKYNTTFVDKARLDMYYIQHATFLWDIQLIFYTLKIIFIPESTEGVSASDERSANRREEEKTAAR